jgi:hypothetical protein
MGRGLSDQQKDILRAALAVNTEVNRGAPTCRVLPTAGEPHDFNVLHPYEPPDTMPELAYVLVLKLPYHGYNTVNGRPGGLCKYVAPTAVTNAQKVSLHKAFHRLVERGLLKQYCLRPSNSVSIGGYLLTQQGIDAALNLPSFECNNLVDAISVFQQVEDGVIVDWRHVHQNEAFTAVMG